MRGRPKKEVIKDKYIHIRMTEGEAIWFNNLCNKVGKGKTQVMFEALRLYEDKHTQKAFIKGEKKNA